MLDSKLIQKNINYVIEKLKTRNVDEVLLKNLSQNINERNKLIFKLNEKQEEKNSISSLLSSNKNSELLVKALKVKNEIKEIETQIEKYQKQLDEILPIIPNIPLDIVPIGQNENDNKEIIKKDSLGRGLVKNIKPHYVIAVEKDIVDFERGTKLSGSRFAIFKNEGARLIRALENFMLDIHTKNGYTEFLPPVMVKSNILFGTGQLPKFKEDLFKIENEDLWMIPTAEVPVTNYFNDEIIDLSKPKKMTSYTLCFRSEAGSGGKDTRGLIRSRQFNKVEMVKITSKEDAMKEFESCVRDAENILELLEIPYRKIVLCTGDLGFSSSITYDLELWLPSEQRFREVSSISYFGDFQARRAKIRYKNENNKIEFAHTINGSGLAIDRVFAALIEQYQNEDGSIDIPQVLIPYMNGIEKI
ncbi:serine--tRNA ligase [Mesomycoplasma moatsii]|uniref:serine--tRNA ligase n=1 Tax=Mesomycoplasma moatsii TaxID=171287 RepID=UPI0003B740A3